MMGYGIDDEGILDACLESGSAKMGIIELPEAD